MMSLPTAMVLAGVFICFGMFGASYFVYRIIMTLLILRSTNSPNDAAFLHRTLLGRKVQPPKVVPEMPDLEIATLADNPKTLKNLRRQQDPTPNDNY